MNVVDKVVLLVVNVLVFLSHWDKTSKDTEKGWDASSFSAENLPRDSKHHFVCTAHFAIAPYTYMGWFRPKEGKIIEKMHFFFSVFDFLITRPCKILGGNANLAILSLAIPPFSQKSFPFHIARSFPHPPKFSLLWPTDRQATSKNSSRACTHTHLPTGFLIFCCHKCHTKSIFTTIFHPFPSLFCLLIQVFPSFKIIPPNDILNNSSF